LTDIIVVCGLAPGQIHPFCGFWQSGFDYSGVKHFSEPSLLPKDHTALLAAAVARAVASETIEKHCLAHAPHSIGRLVTSPLDPPTHRETLAAKLQHFRHKRELLQHSVLVESSGNFTPGPHLHYVTWKQLTLHVVDHNLRASAT
jgi:hypothetical protein